jgi:hypothetical protein
MAELKQRIASLSDFKDIWVLMREAAPDIPFDVANERAQESVLSEVMACCTSGLSPVVIGDDETIVGALLVRRDDFEWGFRNSNAIHVSYTAVAATHRDQGVLGFLFARIKEQRMPVFASVKNDDKLGLVDQLKQLGFARECTAASGWGDLYLWQPSANGGSPVH